MIMLTSAFMLRVMQLKLAYILGPENDARVRLYQNDYTPVVTSAVDDFLEADFDGYEALQLTFVGPPSYDAGNQRYQFQSDILIYTPDGLTLPNDIYGWYVTDSDGEVLWLCERFAAGPYEVGATLVPFAFQFTFTEGRRTA